ATRTGSLPGSAPNTPYHVATQCACWNGVAKPRSCSRAHRAAICCHDPAISTLNGLSIESIRFFLLSRWHKGSCCLGPPAYFTASSSAATAPWRQGKHSLHGGMLRTPLVFFVP